MNNEIRTYSDLRAALDKLTPKQLAQPIQVVKGSSIEEVSECMPVIGIDTVDNWGYEFIRSAHNNQRCGNDVVLLIDGNPHAEDGAVAYEWGDGNLEDHPIYPKNHSDRADWTGPAQRIAREEVQWQEDTQRGLAIIRYRSDNV